MLLTVLALARDEFKLTSTTLASIPIIAITTKSSIKVNPVDRGLLYEKANIFLFIVVGDEAVHRRDKLFFAPAALLFLPPYCH